MTSESKKGGEDSLIEVSWSGRKIFLDRTKLDEWYHEKSFEDRVDFVDTHPFVKGMRLHHFNEIPKSPPDPDDYVLVHWSGKTLMLHRKQLDEWYESSYEVCRRIYCISVVWCGVVVTAV